MYILCRLHAYCTVNVSLASLSWVLRYSQYCKGYIILTELRVPGRYTVLINSSFIIIILGMLIWNWYDADTEWLSFTIWLDAITTMTPVAPFSFNPSMVSNYIHCNVWDEITYPFLNFNGSTVEVQEWILSNFIPYFIMDVITYPCWD